MIVIDMDMPKSCHECPLFNDYYDYPTCYVNQKSSGYNFPIGEKRMDFCPIKCDIEDIRAEIEQTVDEEQKHDEKWAIGLRYAVKIIDKHIKGEQE